MAGSQSARFGQPRPAPWTSAATLSVLGVIALLSFAPGVFAGQPAPAPVPVTPDETQPDWAEGQIVQEIDIRGLIRVDEGTVLKLMRTRKGRPFERRVWDDEFHRIDDSGFFLNVRTTEPISWPGGVKLAIDLVEKASVSKIIFKGNKAVSPTKLMGVIKSFEGGRFDKGQVHLDMQALKKDYEQKAFRDVKVDYVVETVASHRQNIGGREVDVDDEVRVIFTIEEGNPVGVRVIKFAGNKAFTDAQLLAVMSTKHRRLFRAGDLKEDDLDTDKKRLEAHYLRAGYMDISIEKVDVNVSEETYFNWFRKRKRLAEVVLHLNEGPQYFAGTVDITGNQTVEKDEIEAVMKVRPGSVYSDSILQDDEQRVKDLYGERGRVFSRVEYDRKLVTDPERLKKNPNQYDVTINIRESAEISLREVITRGNGKTRDKVIIRQMELFPGDRIDTQKIKIAVQRLKNLNYFNDDVRITPEPTENPEEANLVIDVTEKSTGEFNFGVGVSSVDSFLGNVKLTQRNFDYRDLPKSWRDLIGGNSFVGAGQTASIEAQAGTERSRYSVSFYEPWAFDRPIRLGGSIFHTTDTFSNFDQTNTGFTATVGKRLWGPRWDGEITYRFSFTDIGDIGRRYPPILREQEGSRILSQIRPKLLYDSRDSRILPSKGWLAEAGVEVGGGPLLGDYNWFRPSLDLARYMTIFKLKNGQKHILELRGRAGLIESFGDTDEVPPFLRYYAGGIDTIRGFAYRTITPRESGFQIGGKKLLVGTAEYSMPLYEEIVRGSVFVDAGSAWDGGEPDPRRRITNDEGMRASVGVGLQIRTPFSPLPLRVYFSRAVQKADQDKIKTIDFSFGTSF